LIAQGDAPPQKNGRNAAKRRLADEYDAAQARGEVSIGRPKSIPGENTFTATVSDIGLTSKDIFEARQIRDAEKRRVWAGHHAPRQGRLHCARQARRDTLIGARSSALHRGEQLWDGF
jgi:hypothetical protein